MAITLADIAKHNPKVTVPKRAVPRKIVMPWEVGSNVAEVEASMEPSSDLEENNVRLQAIITQEQKRYLLRTAYELKQNGVTGASESMVVRAALQHFMDFGCKDSVPHEVQKANKVENGIKTKTAYEQGAAVDSQANLFYEPVYTVREVASSLQVSVPTVYRLLNSGDLKYVMQVRRKRVLKSDLDRYIRKLRGINSTEG